MKRAKVHDKRGDRRFFSATADKVHVKNVLRPPMRGGIRL